MREFSKINQSVWSSKRFKSLNDAHKLFYLYCLCCKHANSAGCFYSPIGYMMVDLGWKENAVSEAIDRVSETGLIAYDRSEDTLYIDRWFSYNQPTNPKHAAKIISDMEMIPYSYLKKDILDDFSKCLEDKPWKISEKSSEAIDRLYHRVSSKMTTKTVTVTETETEDNKLKGVSKKLGFEDLTINHISEWLDGKRAGGKYLTVDEFELLEKFKDYCRSKNPKYTDYVAAFRNAFKWQNIPMKGNPDGSHQPKLTQHERLKAAGDRAKEILYAKYDREEAEARSDNLLSHSEL